MLSCHRNPLLQDPVLKNEWVEVLLLAELVDEVLHCRPSAPIRNQQAHQDLDFATTYAFFDQIGQQISGTSVPSHWPISLFSCMEPDPCLEVPIYAHKC